MRLLLLSAVVAAATAWTTVGLADSGHPPVPCPWIIPTGVTGPTPHWLGYIDIPRLGERVPFSRGTSVLFHGLEDNAVNHGPALYPNTFGFGNMPGSGGTIGILGHRTTHTHPFCRFDLMEQGYVIKLEMPRVTYIFRVIYIDRWADPNSWIYFEHPERFDDTKPVAGVPGQYLTLAACTPPRYETHRVNIVAKLVAVRHSP